MECKYYLGVVKVLEFHRESGNIEINNTLMPHPSAQTIFFAQDKIEIFLEKVFAFLEKTFSVLNIKFLAKKFIFVYETDGYAFLANDKFLFQDNFDFVPKKFFWPKGIKF